MNVRTLELKSRCCHFVSERAGGTVSSSVKGDHALLKGDFESHYFLLSLCFYSTQGYGSGWVEPALTNLCLVAIFSI